MYDEPITVTDIAANAYLSPSYFSFMFRNITGFTVKNYLNRYRLYRAALDLRESSKQIVEIAYANGFSSQQGFTRSFTQMYGVAPAQFRMQCPNFSPFPPENLFLTVWKEPSMELMDCFKNVRFTHKDAYYVVGVEVDINYNAKGGTNPIGDAWSKWKDEELWKQIPSQVSPGVTYGLTHSETVDNTAKYMVGVEVSDHNAIPPAQGLVVRRFDACDYAIFDTTLEILWTGEFWRTFYTNWLPGSGYAMPDNQIREEYPTFNKHPDLEVYPEGFEGTQTVFQIYAPVVKL